MHNVSEYLKVADIIPLLINDAGAFYLKIYIESKHISI
jgi:hypothetical protein